MPTKVLRTQPHSPSNHCAPPWFADTVEIIVAIELLYPKSLFYLHSSKQAWTPDGPFNDHSQLSKAPFGVPYESWGGSF